MNKLQLLELIEKNAKEYRLNAIESINRNAHMLSVPTYVRQSYHHFDLVDTPVDQYKISQQAIDIILTDFINFVGNYQGIDYGLYIKDLISYTDNLDIKY